MLDSFQQRINAAVEHFRGQIATLRTNRATPAVIEQLTVECYGSRMPLIQVASITAPEPSLLVIQPWDASLIKDIERSIQASPLGFQPTVDGQNIRISLPPLTEDRRRELLKVLNQHEETAKISMKRIREETLNRLRESVRASTLSEDAFEKNEKDIQKSIEAGHALVAQLVKDKSEDIMTV